MDKRSKIKNLNKAYFQKSMFFLYPLLKVSKKLLPISTYISWSYSTEGHKYVLACRYKKFSSPTDVQLEKQYLLNHPEFLNYYELDDDTCLYLFSFDNKYRSTWDLFLEGSYSKFSPSVKSEILAFYKTGTSTYDYINSYLYPSEHYQHYAELLNVDVDVLKDTKELINKPDTQKETLTIKPKQIDLSSLNSNSKT